MLFIPDRAALFSALRHLCEAGGVAAVDIDITVRPRERRPRKMRLAGRRLRHNPRCLWFFHGMALPTEEEIRTLTLIHHD